MHRKTRMFPLGQIVAVITVASLLVAAVLLLFSVTAQQASARTRPYWNGKGVWKSDTEPMCTWLDVHHIGLIRWDNGNTYYAECLPEGPKGQGPYSWSLVSL